MDHSFTANLLSWINSFSFDIQDPCISICIALTDEAVQYIAPD